MPTRRCVLAAGAAGLLSATAGLIPRANAQAVKKPVHVIVGFPAGGGTDIIARILADRLRGTYARDGAGGEQARRRRAALG